MNTSRPLRPEHATDAAHHYAQRLEQLAPALAEAMRFARTHETDIPSGGSDGGRRAPNSVADPTQAAALRRVTHGRTDRERVSDVLRVGGPVDQAVGVLAAFVAVWTPPLPGAQPDPAPVESRGVCMLCGGRLVSGNVAGGKCKSTCWHLWDRAGRPSKGTAGWSRLADRATGVNNEGVNP